MEKGTRMNPNRPHSSTGKSQAEKITQFALVSHPHRNQQLFSDHYLNVILPGHADWQTLASEAQAVLRDLQHTFAAHTPSNKEAQTEEALSPVGERMELLPIAPPTNAIREETEQVVERLIQITRTGKEARQLLADWLHTEFQVQEPGKYLLENFATLEQLAFVEEVRKRRPNSAGRLTLAA